MTKNGRDLRKIIGKFHSTLNIPPGINSEKLIIALTMFMGRLGGLTIVFALANKQQNNKRLIKYPEGKVTIG